LSASTLGVLSTLFARARFDELVADNPARELPRVTVRRPPS
jgi:hypothetical protein